MLQQGETAPDFTLPDAHGNRVTLYTLLEKGPVVLYFYPKDETKGCTAQACAFRDDYESFKDAGAEVVGISSDSPEAHRKFAENQRLPFVLLSDSKKVVRNLYKVPNSLIFIPGRVTYVIRPDRSIALAFNSMFQPQLHIKETLTALKAG